MKRNKCNLDVIFLCVERGLRKCDYKDIWFNIVLSQIEIRPVSYCRYGDREYKLKLTKDKNLEIMPQKFMFAFRKIHKTLKRKGLLQ